MTAALYYHPEAYTTSDPKLMGCNAAGESFLRGFLSHSTEAPFFVQAQMIDHVRHFAARVAEAGRWELVQAIVGGEIGELAKAGVVYHLGPGIAEHAWQRSSFGHGAWSLCGITHTTASATVMDVITALITAPVQPWDALICTSTAVKGNVERLSFHAKAHLLAMYQALEAAAQATGKQVVLFECGWHANDAIARAYKEAAALACPLVRIISLDGRKAEDRQAAWAGADIFCSLSDNIQETFGLAPIEAMAAGLPVVVSDWDGYRDTVRDGIDGFCISTLMPQAGLGSDLAARHALAIDTYDMYCGHTCSLVAVDVPATTQAFIWLFTSLELRRQMGESGRTRARAAYVWAVIIPQYETLGAELDVRRKKESPTLSPLAHSWPARMYPFCAFAAYPTQTLTQQTVLGLVDADAQTALTRTLAYQQLAMVDSAKAILSSEAEMRSVLMAAATGPKTAAELVAAIPAEQQAHVFRALIWLVKLGVLKVCA
jgi:hypothetical protein